MTQDNYFKADAPQKVITLLEKLYEFSLAGNVDAAKLYIETVTSHRDYAMSERNRWDRSKAAHVSHAWMHS